jgi:hypothetical protein
MSITNGSPSSASELQTQLAGLSANGQSVLDDIAKARNTTLFRFDQGLSALNSRQQFVFDGSVTALAGAQDCFLKGLVGRPWHNDWWGIVI